MSTSALRASLLRAGGGIARNFPSTVQASQHGRTAAYRRIGDSLRSYSEASLRVRHHGASTILPPVALRSHFLPSAISASPASSVRHVSFKELREQRAKEKAAGGQKAEPKPAAAAAAATSAAPQPEPETKKAAEPERSAADDAFAQFKKQADKEWAARQKAAAEEEQQESKSKEEGEETAEGEQKEKKKKDDAAPPPPHGGKTPWQVFTETLQQEFKASKEWNESTKQLGGTINDFNQNPNVQRAKSAYSKAAEAATSTTGKALFGTASAIGKGAAWTWDTPVAKVVRKGAAAVGSGVDKATKPIRDTKAYKDVKDVIDDGASSRYGGWVEKEERRRKREERDLKMGFNPNKIPENLEEDPNAGTNVTVHKDAAWKEAWKDFRDNSSIGKRFSSFGSVYRESENPLISTARSVSDRIAGFFAENETAMVIKKFREMDPNFQLDPFLNEMRNYILPEVLEAYVKGDVETLKLWLSAAQFQVYHALMQQYTTAGLKSDGKILDIRGVDILSARILDPGEIPVFVLMCRTQEVHVYRNAKSGELAAGMEDKVQQVTYAIGVTRIPEEVSNPETRGWKFIEMQKSARDYL
ncbi:Putative Tim44-like domain, NTF2-like domain superfamily protein [Septoria linicola]|uniref:Mitochondrial import inner membrane translocase subunit TIM44 n=1 Tax=Septoria linicola TaxID=215465 RepID=A0A9Q9AJI5_9PEZI|nr:putative Tim44-like domain, NTF2-like domain superfamily protein [Septoria linicola]USW47247.1 Putative Tim44-like domain, NTF2-like domain superfamily protein [Septoria linicola]